MVTFNSFPVCSLILTKANLPYILVFAFIFCLSPVFAQTRHETKYFDKDWKPCTKTKAAFYREIEYDSIGKPVGTTKDFFISGKCQWQGHLLSENPDVIEGLCIWYDENGNITQKGSYTNGKIDGEFIEYFPDGTVKSTTNYAMGQLHGERNVYSGTGNIVRQGYYESGQKHGKQIEYRQDGNISRYENFDHGKLHGEKRTFWLDGQVWQVFYYEQGKLEGESISYHENGRLNSKGVYKNGNCEGESKKYYRSGNIEKITLREDGKTISETGFYENGEVSYKKTNQGDVKNTHEEYFENGTLKRSVTHFNKDEYSEKVYNEDGELIVFKMPDTLFVHPVKDNIACLYGFKDYQNNWVFKPQFERVDDLGNYYKVVKNGKFGVVTLLGKQIIPVEYSDIQFSSSKSQVSFYNYKLVKGYLLPVISDLFKVSKDNRWGIIDKSGKQLIPIEYDKVGDLINNHIILKKDMLFGFCDTTGKVYLPRFRYLQDFCDGYAIFSNSVMNNTSTDKREFGAINDAGQMIIPDEYDWISPCTKKTNNENNYLIWVSEKDKYGAFNRKGEKLLDNFDYPKINDGQKNSTKIEVVKQNNKVGILSFDGELIVPCQYDSICLIPHKLPIMEGSPVAIVKTWQKWAAVDNKGRIKTKWYDELQAILLKVEFDENYYSSVNFIALKDSKYGFINGSDSTLIPFHHNLAFINEDKKTVVCFIEDSLLTIYKIDNTAQPLFIEDNFDFSNGVAKFCHSKDRGKGYPSNFDCGVVNMQGKVLLMPEYDVDINTDGRFVYTNSTGISGSMNSKGKCLTNNNNFRFFGRNSNGAEWIITNNHKVGLYDVQQEKFIIDTLFEAVTPIDYEYHVYWANKSIFYTEEDGNKHLQLSYGWELYDSSNNKITDGSYEYPVVFTDSIEIVSGSDGEGYGNLGLLRVDGTEVLACIYSEIEEQDNGMFMIKVDGKWGMAGKNGNVIVEPAWDDVSQLMGDYAFYWKKNSKGYEMGIVDTKGEDVEIENLSNLFTFYANKDRDYKSGKYEKKTLPEIISYYEKLDGYFVDKPESESKLKKEISDILIVEAFQDYGYEKTSQGCWAGDCADYSDVIYDKDFKVEYDGYPRVYAAEEKSEVTLFSITDKTFSYGIISSDFHYSQGGGGGRTDYEKSFYNMGITDDDSIYDLSSSNIYDTETNYSEKMNQVLVNLISSIEDIELDCRDKDSYFEYLKEKYMITSSGLRFYLEGEHEIYEGTFAEEYFVTVPYSLIKDIINPKGPLADFLIEGKSRQ